MLKFTNSKVLTLSAMLVLGTASAFGQAADSVWTKPNDAKAKFPILYSTVASTPAAFDNLPGNSVNKGVYYRVFDENNVAYRPALETTKPDGNEVKTTVWAIGDNLGVFLGDKQAGNVLINLSTKYLADVKNLSLKLKSENLGKVATSTAKWNLKISVFNLDGTLAQKSDVLKDGDASDAVFASEGAVFSTKEDTEKVVNLFRSVKDPITDETRFNEEGLNNKYIQIELKSDPVAIVDVEGTKSHFAPALIISDFNMDFAEPGITLAVDKNEFEAGMGFVSCETGELTVKISNISLPKANATVKDVLTLAEPTNGIKGAAIKDVVLEVVENTCVATGTYNFQPTTMTGKTSGQFTAKINEDSPIRLALVSSSAITTNSMPELTLAEDHLYFGKQVETKNVTIAGKNIPKYTDGGDIQGLDFMAYERKTTDQPEWALYGNVGVTEHFKVSDCGVILKSDGATPYLAVTLTQSINDVTRPEVWNLRVNDEYTIKKALTYYKTAEGVAGVGALWLTFDGHKYEGIGGPDNVFFSPYKENDDLAGDRTRSRVKEYRLHASEINPTEADGKSAVIKFSMGKEDADNNNTDNQEFRFRLATDKSWINSNTGIIDTTINTVDPAVMKALREEGLPIYVEFVPNQDGFKQPGSATNITWAPDTYELKAVTEQKASNGDPVYITAAAANLYGDTRANLWSNMNKLNSIIGDIMNGSWTTPFDSWHLAYPDFQKYYGKEYLGTDCTYTNPDAVGSFYVVGYNLEKPVNVVQDGKGDYKKDAFTYKVVNKLDNDAVVADGTITPNKYGEVMAMVYVTFAPKAKVEGAHKAQDLFTVKSGENVITNYNYADEVEKFDYTKYENKAEVYGFVNKPVITINVNDGKAITAFANKSTVVPVTVIGEEFNPMSNEAIKIALTANKTPFTLSINNDAKVNANGRFEAIGTLAYAPTVENLCTKDNSIAVEAPCKLADAVIEGTPYWDGNAPELADMNYGDIDGHTATLKWAPVAGAEYYKVKVGHMVPKNISENVFMSEVRASEGDQSLAVELFNGTASVINPKMLVNYYLKITRISADASDVFYGHFTNTDINLISETRPWKNEALIVKDFVAEKSYDKVLAGTATPVEIVINKNYKYEIQLMEGENQIDIFTFGEAGAQLSRISVANLMMNKGKFNIAEWETENTTLKDGNGLAYYIWQESTNFEFSVAGDGAESNGIVPAGNIKDGKITTKVYNLKKGTLYDVMVTAYNTCLTNEKGELMSSTNGYSKDFIKTSVSGQAPTGDVTFDYNGAVTGNGDINANAIKVVAGEGVVTIYNAAGKKVVVNNILGQAIANTVLTSDNATISAPAGLVVVTVEGEKAVKAIIK